jgi:hypothetical protein
MTRLLSPFLRRSTFGLLALAAAGSAQAGVGNDVPSCYAANKIDFKKPQPEQEIFVIIDQTTLFDDKLKRSIKENLWSNLRPNTSFTVLRFSAFSQGRYTEVVNGGSIEPPLPDKLRDDTSTKLLGKFDACMAGQLRFARDLALKAVDASLSDASGGLAKSDILAALKDVSARVKASSAKSRLVLLASDMLENSSVASFYASSNKVRRIDVAKELAAAERAGLIGDFGGAHVHVIGAGLIGPAGSTGGTYREPQTLSALNGFWTQYIAKSGAELAQFGAPALLTPVR